MIDWQVMKSFDDERSTVCVALRLGRMKATGFYTEAEIMLTDEQVADLIRELQQVRRKL
jgi:hypothetical protein